MVNKANSKVWALVNNIEPGTSKNITWLDAWAKLGTWGGFDCAVEHHLDGSTTTDIYIDNKKVNTLKFGPEAWSYMDRDWNWDVVLGKALDYIFDEGLIKKPRAKRKDVKSKAPNKVSKNSAKHAQISQNVEEVNSYIGEDETSENNTVFVSPSQKEDKIRNLKRQLGNLSSRKSMYKRQGKDVTEVLKQIDDIKSQIESLKK